MSTTTTNPPHHYHFAITMTCTGCSGAVDRVLKKMEGISSPSVPPPPPSLLTLSFPFLSPPPRPPAPIHSQKRKKKTDISTPQGVNKYEVSLSAQTADVYADEGLAYETVLEKIKKTGKAVTKGVRDGEEVGV